jgi:hypothetical protein
MNAIYQSFALASLCTICALPLQVKIETSESRIWWAERIYNAEFWTPWIASDFVDRVSEAACGEQYQKVDIADLESRFRNVTDN